MRDKTLLDVISEEQVKVGANEEFKEVAIALKELGLCQELGMTDDEFMKLMIDKKIF